LSINFKLFIDGIATEICCLRLCVAAFGVDTIKRTLAVTVMFTAFVPYEIVLSSSPLNIIFRHNVHYKTCVLKQTLEHVRRVYIKK